MEPQRPAPNTNLKRAAELRELANLTARAAMTAAPSDQDTVLRAAERLSKIADNDERKGKLAAAEPPVVVLPFGATVEELRKARRRQATRRGEETYLPSWPAMALGLPNTFLRCALFSTGRSVQANSENVLEGDQGALVANKEIVSFPDLTLNLTGYELCQFDRHVYATCLDYYRDAPLSPDESNEYVNTSFYEFAKRMGLTYGLNPHKAIRASLLRLSFAQIHIRRKGSNLEIPKLLRVSFEDRSTDAGFKGGDKMLLRVTESVAELFGPASWTAVDKEAIGYEGVMGWLASFYAGHSRAAWLSVKSLYGVSGYESNMRNFKTSLTRALNKLKDEGMPARIRVSTYHFTDDGDSLMVLLAAWKK